jgi:hypothetical protein
MTAVERSVSRWGRDFDPERLARLELAMWKAYYRGRPGLLFRLLVRANQAQAGVGWVRAIVAAFWLTWAAARFARARDDDERLARPIAPGRRGRGRAARAAVVGGPA